MTAFEAAAREMADLLQRVERLEAELRSLRTRQDGLPRTAYRVREVADMTGLKPETLQGWIRDGRLEATDMGGWYAISPEVAEALVPRRAS